MNLVKLGKAGPQVQIAQNPGLCIALGWIFLFLPLLVFVYFPNQDGPAHVNAAAALNRLAAGDPFFLSYFKLTPRELTNWVGETLYRLLLHIAQPRRIDMLGAIIYVAYALLIIHLCSRVFLKIKADSAILFYPLIFTNMFQMGSYNLSLGAFGFLVVVSVCSAYVAERKYSLLFALSAALLFTYTLHVEMALLAMVAIGICGLWIGVNAFLTEEGPHARRYRGAVVETAKVAAACVPALIFMAYFFLHNKSQIPTHPQYPGLVSRLLHFFLLTGIASYSLFGLAISACLFCGTAILVFLLITKRFGGRVNKSQDWLLLNAACLGGLILFLPDGLGDIFAIEERIMPPFLISVAIWLALGIQPVRQRKFIVMAVLSILALQTLDRSLAFASFNRQVKEFTAIRRCIPDKAAFISVDLDTIAPPTMARLIMRSLSHPFSTMMRFGAFDHFPGAVFADREVVDVSNYEALEICPYFQLKYQPWLADMVGMLDVGEKAILEAKTGFFGAFVKKLNDGRYPVNYLITSTFDPETKSSEPVRAVTAVVDSNYARTCASPSGAVSVYRRLDSGGVE